MQTGHNNNNNNIMKPTANKLIANSNHPPDKVPMAFNLIAESSKIKLKPDDVQMLPLILCQSVSTLLCRYHLLSSACRAFVTIYYT